MLHLVFLIMTIYLKESRERLFGFADHSTNLSSLFLLLLWAISIAFFILKSIIITFPQLPYSCCCYYDLGLQISSVRSSILSRNGCAVDRYLNVIIYWILLWFLPTKHPSYICPSTSIDECVAAEWENRISYEEQSSVNTESLQKKTFVRPKQTAKDRKATKNVWKSRKHRRKGRHEKNIV